MISGLFKQRQSFTVWCQWGKVLGSVCLMWQTRPFWGPQAETTQGLEVQVSNPEGKKVTDCAWLHFFIL